MFPEPSIPGPPTSDTPPDSSRLNHGPGEPEQGLEMREKESLVRISRAGFGRVYSAGGLENLGGIVVRVLDWNLNEMEKEQVCNKNGNQSMALGMQWGLGMVSWRVHQSLLLNKWQQAQRGVKASRSIGS